MAVDFIRLTAKQIDELPSEQTVFFFPVGPLEDHGPHLPVGLDLTEAETLCRMAAERLERERPGWVGVIMPAAPLGVSSNTSVTAITVRGYVLRDWLVDCCKSLIRARFRHFVCISGQLGPRQLTAIEDAGRLLMWRGPFTWLISTLSPASSPRKIQPTFISASSALVGPTDAKKSPFWSDPTEHGALRDSSVALSLGWMNGQTFTPATAEALDLKQNPRRGSHLSRGLDLLLGKRSGFWGPASPANANPGIGESALRSSLDQIYPKLEAVWAGANPSFTFRSWYSILPPNKSFFKAWLLSFSIIVVMFMWLYLSIGSFIP
jgi:creatinine amidohydrolase/Fe(II)-dependent formamide hydrolase-like protein